MKKVVGIVICLMVAVGMYGQTGSNPCNASPTYSACSSPTSAVLLNSWYSGSGASTSPSCGTNPTTGQYWVRYTAGNTYDFIRIGALRPTGSNKIDNPAFEVYTLTTSGICPGTQPTLSLVTCVNNNPGTADEYHYMTVSFGTTYYFRFFDRDGSSSGSFNFQYCITEYLPGDFACNAVSISPLPFNYLGNTSGYNNHAQAGVYSPGNVTIGCSGKDYGLGGGRDVFFSYVSPGNEWIRVNLSNTSTLVDAELSILQAISSTCSNSVLGATQGSSQLSGYLYECYGPSGTTFNGGFMAPTGVDSSICRVIYLDAATTYLFKMDTDYSSNTTPFTIDIESFTPSNGDGCANAVALSENVTQSFSNENCNYSWGPDDPDPVDLCAGTIENTMWMSFTSDGTGNSITVALSNITCENADVVALPPPGSPGWYQYADAWQFGVVSGSCGGPYTGEFCSSGSGTTYNAAFIPSPNTTYYLVMDGNGGAECSWDINVSGGITLLAAEFLSFDAVAEGGDVLINWVTSREENLSHYELEHSNNGIDYLSIDYQEAKGTNLESAAYAYVHRQPEGAMHYYRIKEVDLSGAVSYSSIKVVKLQNSNAHHLVEIYPVPASRQLTMRYVGSSDTNLSVQLITGAGISLWQESYWVAKGATYQLPIDQFAPGIYFMEVNDGTRTQRKRVVIQ